MIVAADTSSADLTVVLADELGAVLATWQQPGRGQQMLVGIDDVLATADITLEDVRRVAIVTGPGSFTGIRVGIATVAGLIRGRSLAGHALAAVGVPTLAALAAGHDHDDGHEQIVACDVMRGEAYAQRYRWRGAAMPEPTGAPEVVAADTVDIAPMTAGGLARAAAHTPVVRIEALEPIYGREPDATPPAHLRGVSS